MKKAYITGITGTVAPYLKRELEKNGYSVFDKHIRVNQESDIVLLEEYLEDVKPDIVFHLALGPLSFTETLARYCEHNKKVFVYISTVSVFEDNDGGPYTVSSAVNVINDYGKYKYQNEELVRSINKDSFVLRIGWQISELGDTSSNNMCKFIKENTNELNEIVVSDRFYPSTSFLNDTVKAIRTTVEGNEPGLYFVNSNQNKSLFDLVMMLDNQFDLKLNVLKDSTFKRNDIMLDPRVNIKKF